MYVMRYTPEYKKLMELLAEPRGDEEGSHLDAEEALCSYLRSIGLSEMAEAWEKAKNVQHWWYA